MGLLDFLKKEQKRTFADSSSISEEERKYYQPDAYYTFKSYPGTQFERDVITFEERKKTCIPSKGGLYVAEILLLEYCSYGTYPKPKNGYPGFWWFEYGIRDVLSVLQSLEKRKFIQMDILKGKYYLTETGEQELKENEYVPFMHKCKDKTTEDTRFGPVFNVWEVNRRLGNGKTSSWESIIEDIRNEQSKYRESKKEASEKILKDMDSWDPKTAEEIRKINKRLNESELELQEAKNAEEQYKNSGDVDTYIKFWENIWENGGPKTLGSRWTFTLPDLYIKQKRYNDALKILKKIRNPYYQDKKKSYIERIKTLKSKGKQPHTSA